jgi:catechol 2,3-dioxygenase-like lactoylglutathione lyase family enzyme
MPDNPLLGQTGFHHVAIKTRDWEGTLKFYKEGLGCTEAITWDAAPTRAAMLDLGGKNYIEVFEDLDWDPAPLGPIFHFAVRTTRLDDSIERVRGMGAKITYEPKDITIKSTNGRGDIPARIAFFEGPNGESIELFQNEQT